ncbi:MAG: hypothetical protein R3Y05_01205 [bacterium]
MYNTIKNMFLELNKMDLAYKKDDYILLEVEDSQIQFKKIDDYNYIVDILNLTTAATTTLYINNHCTSFNNDYDIKNINNLNLLIDDYLKENGIFQILEDIKINDYTVNLNDDEYYVIFKNDIEFMKISKQNNTIAAVKKLLEN